MKMILLSQYSLCTLETGIILTGSGEQFWHSGDTDTCKSAKATGTSMQAFVSTVS